MERRAFLTLIFASAASAPLRAQSVKRSYLVGLVTAFNEAEMKPLRSVFLEKLSQFGWREGSNLELDFRISNTSPVEMAKAAEALVQRNPDVIVTQGSPALAAVRAYSKTIPIVFMLVADPVGQKLVDSLAHPGGHLTGFTNFEFSVGGKWLELLKQASPKMSQAVLIANPGNQTSSPFSAQIEAAGRAIGVDVRTIFVRSASDIEDAIRTLAGSAQGGLVTLPDFLPVTHRDLIVRLTGELGVPSIHPFKTFPLNGALMSYGLDFPELYRQTAVYVDLILRGTKPADLPVQAPTKFELVLNLKTAKALGVEVPPSLLAGADEVIE